MLHKNIFILVGATPYLKLHKLYTIYLFLQRDDQLDTKIVIYRLTEMNNQKLA